MPYNKERYERLRQEWFEENGPCQHCGTWENLEVDHINPETKLSHKIWTWREELRIAELEKCQVLCHDCHWEKTVEECFLPTRIHGTWSMYVTYHCRCDDCKQANTNYKRAYRERRGGVVSV